MGKAYSEEEKEQIRIKLMEEGVKLFHENGSKTLSIRELTKRAGIAQGGFYSFFEDKDALIRSIVSYRGDQKIRLVEERLAQSLDSPKEFLVNEYCFFMLDLIRKAQVSQMYADASELVLRDMKNDRESFHMELLNEFFEYWRQNGYTVEVDMAGLENLIAASLVLGTYGKCLDEEYMEQTVEIMLRAGLEKYVEVNRK